MKLVEEAKQPMGMHPKKFAMWLFIVTVSMLFAALTSAYLVRQGEGNWMEFTLPSLFWVNTIVIVVSSLTMHFAYVSAKRDNLEMVKLGVLLTTVLGVAFLVAQFYAWGQLVAAHVHLVNADASGVSGSFVYILSGLHMAHIIGGVVYLLITLNSAFKFRVHSRNLTQIQMCATYWHFLDVLWVYLFVFLLLNR